MKKKLLSKKDLKVNICSKIFKNINTTLYYYENDIQYYDI